MSEIVTIRAEIDIPKDILYLYGIPISQTNYFVKKNFLLELYREGKISLTKAAKLLGLSRKEIIGILKDAKIPMNYGLEEYEEDLETAKSLGMI